MSFLLPKAPKIPPIPAAPPPPPQLPNPAIGDAISQTQQAAAGAQGLSSTIKTSPQGVTSPGPSAMPGLAAVMPAGAAMSLIGGGDLSGSYQPNQQKTLLG